MSILLPDLRLPAFPLPLMQGYDSIAYYPMLISITAKRSKRQQENYLYFKKEIDAAPLSTISKTILFSPVLF